jgi:hypothetical protein
MVDYYRAMCHDCGKVIGYTHNNDPIMILCYECMKKEADK